MKSPTIIHQTPASRGYCFPAEWERHEGTWFSWPRPEGISFPGKYHTVPENLARIMFQIQSREKVHINVPNENWEYIVRRQLKEFGCPLRNIDFFHIKTNESWCRDHGPAFVVKKAGARGSAETRDVFCGYSPSAGTPGEGRGGGSTGIDVGNPHPNPPPEYQGRGKLGPQKSHTLIAARLAIVDWGFNAWGEKYPPYDDDDAVPTWIAERLKLPVFYPGDMSASPMSSTNRHGRDSHATVVMEGGSVDFNGAGTVLTTTDCLLNKNRNPTLSRKRIEQYLKDFYGQQHVCWLTGGIAGDDTDGHIDDLARFISPTKIVVGVETDPKDQNYRVLRDVRKQLDGLRDQAGDTFEIVEIPMPKPIIHDGQRLPATYVNFYFINGACLVPTYRDRKNDRQALAILQKHLPKRTVIGIDCVELIWGLGAIHCLTQQQPAVAK